AAVEHGTGDGHERGWGGASAARLPRRVGHGVDVAARLPVRVEHEHEYGVRRPGGKAGGAGPIGPGPARASGGASLRGKTTSPGRAREAAFAARPPCRFAHEYEYEYEHRCETGCLGGACARRRGRPQRIWRGPWPGRARGQTGLAHGVRVRQRGPGPGSAPGAGAWARAWSLAVCERAVRTWPTRRRWVANPVFSPGLGGVHRGEGVDARSVWR